MKTSNLTVRVKIITRTKLKRYFNFASYNCILESLIELTEENNYIKNKLIEKINKKQGK